VNDDATALAAALARPHRRIVLDVGCGDGRATARLARKEPETLAIGLDANLDMAARVRRRAGRDASRGGVPNLALVRASAEALPRELAGRADEVRVEYPWGSLLAGLLSEAGAPDVLAGLRAALRPGGRLWIVLNARATPDDAADRLRAGLEAAGFVGIQVGRTGVAPSTGWSKRLAAGRPLDVVLAEAQAPA